MNLVKTAFECGFSGWPDLPQLPVFRIPKPFLIEFITASREIRKAKGQLSGRLRCLDRAERTACDV